MFNFIANNMMVQTALSMTAAGLVTFFVRDIWSNVFQFVKRECTTSVILTSNHESYHRVRAHLQAENSFRTYKVSNGRWGNSDVYVFSFGYGSHLVRYKNLYMLISVTKENANQTEYDKDAMVISMLGRDVGPLKLFLQEAMAPDKSPSELDLYSFSDGWHFVRRIPKRSFDTIFIEDSLKIELKECISTFISSEKLYKNLGLPYQLGILLYGPPGTGKSSIVRALASEINYGIYYLSPSLLTKLPTAVASLPNKTILVIEDIDSNVVTEDREEDEKTPVFGKFGLGDILNSIDGLLAPTGRILISTTNHIEKLDAALIRPGRIDYKIEIGYPTDELKSQFIKTYLPGSITDSSLTALSIPELQNLVFKKRGNLNA